MDADARRWRATLVRWVIGLLLILASFSSTAQSQLVIQFDVKPQPLGDALRSLAAQVNANIIYDPGLVRGQNAQGFVMKSTLDAALTRILKGTGLGHQYVNEKTVTLVRLDTGSRPISTATGASSTKLRSVRAREQ